MQKAALARVHRRKAIWLLGCADLLHRPGCLTLNTELACCFEASCVEADPVMLLIFEPQHLRRDVLEGE